MCSTTAKHDGWFKPVKQVQAKKEDKETEHTSSKVLSSFGMLGPIPLLNADEAKAAAQACENARRHAAFNPGFFACKSHVLYPWVYQLAQLPQLLSTVKSCLGPNVILLDSRVYYKPGQSADHAPWHQDASEMLLKESSKEQTLTVFIALTKANNNNGGLETLPASFQEKPPPIFPCESAEKHHSHSIVPYAISDTAEFQKTTVMKLDAGDCLFMHPNLPHRSGPNTSSNARIGVSLQFAATSVEPAAKGQTAILASGEDLFGSFVNEQVPTGDLNEIELKVHEYAVQQGHSK